MGFRLLHKLPANCTINFQQFLYNKEGFLKTNNDLPQSHFYWVDVGSNVAMAHVAFSLEEGEVSSPYKSPFGGIEFSPELGIGELATFVIFLEKMLIEKGIRFINFSQPPESYMPQDKLYEVLGDLQYKARPARIFQSISIKNDEKYDALTSMEERRLRKCVRAGFKFRAMEVSELSEVFASIGGWRTKIDKPLSMNWKDLFRAQKDSPDAYLPFGVFDDKKLVAATIAIRVSKDILYHFYPAHNPEYNNYSPMVMLVDGLYTWCQENEIRLLDLGTSYVNGKMNQSLFRFKSHLGGEESRALVFRKTLSSRQIV